MAIVHAFPGLAASALGFVWFLYYFLHIWGARYGNMLRWDSTTLEAASTFVFSAELCLLFKWHFWPKAKFQETFMEVVYWRLPAVGWRPHQLIWWKWSTWPTIDAKCLFLYTIENRHPARVQVLHLQRVLLRQSMRFWYHNEAIKFLWSPFGRRISPGKRVILLRCLLGEPVVLNVIHVMICHGLHWVATVFTRMVIQSHGVLYGTLWLFLQLIADALIVFRIGDVSVHWTMGNQLLFDGCCLNFPIILCVRVPLAIRQLQHFTSWGS